MAWREATDPDNPQNTAAGGASDMVKHTVELAWLDQLRSADSPSVLHSLVEDGAKAAGVSPSGAGRAE